MTAIELLENRTLLNGNVSASAQGGDLVLQGDAVDNHLVITQPKLGTVRITGEDGTKINGKQFADLPQFAADLVIKMQQGGVDEVAIQGAFKIPDDLRAQLGAGELLIEGSFGAVTVGDEVNAQAGADGHVTLRNEVRAGGKTSINAPAGGDANFVGGQSNLPNFAAAKFDHSLNINNPYFPVVPGTVWTYKTEGVDDETGEPFTQDNIVQVQSNTRIIEGVKVHVVRDRVYEDGLLIEDTFDWYAQDNNGNVWYFGEDVTNLEYDDQGRLIGKDHDGSWTAGEDDAQAGVIMEAKPRIGHRYYQEFAPGNVLDHAEGLALNQKATVPAGSYTNVFRTEESSVVEPFSLANKLYAPGVGTIAEFELDIEDLETIETVRLVSLTLNGKPVKQVVPTSGFTGVNASDSRFVGGAVIGGATAINADGPVVVNGAKFNGALAIGSKAEIIMVDSILSGDTALTTNDAVSLNHVFAAKTISLLGDPEDLFIFNSEIARLIARFGSANNTLFVKDSEIDILDADGGAGHNAFKPRGHNDFDTLWLVHFAMA